MPRTAALFLILTFASTAPAVDSRMLNLLMPEPEVVTGADVERLKASSFGKYVLSMMQLEGREFDSFVAMTGFDPRRDLREVLMAADSASSESPGKGILVLRGVFDETKITALASVHAGLVTSYNGATLLMPPASGASTPPAIALLGGNLLLMGPEAMVKSAIDRQRSRQTLNASLAARIQAASNDYDAWLVTTAPPSSFAGRVNNPNVAGAMKGDLLQAIETMSAGVRFGADVQLGAEANTRSERDATALTDVVRFLLSMAVSNAPPAFTRIAESLQMSASGRIVRFSATIPEAAFEQLLSPRRRAPRSPAD
jgi:hypothetical protein